MRGRPLHAERLNVGNGSFGSFNGVSVFVCEREGNGEKSDNAESYCTESF